MLLGLANLNPTVGAIESNTNKVIASARDFVRQGCDIAIFSEMVIAGYPTEDLVLWPEFVEQQWQALLRIAESFKESPMYIAVGLAVARDDKIYNCAALLRQGKILGIVPKQELPTYVIFYEARTFTPGVRGEISEYRGVPFGDLLFETSLGKFALEICEDLWIDCGPLMSRVARGAEFSINLSASPWRLGIVQARRDLMCERSKTAGIPLIYVNQFGGNDSLVFDGSSLIASGGAVLLETERWKENNVVFDFSPQAHCTGLHSAEFFSELVNAMTTGIADYYTKTNAFKKIGVALSGGKDSAIVLLLACDVAQKLGRNPRELIYAFSLPSKFNSETTRTVARELAHDLDVNFIEDSIEDARQIECDAAMRLSQTDTLAPLTLQNIQTRIRAQRMWNWSNQAHGLWLQAGNMSEKAVGYTTIGGDLSGGFAPIANIPKTIVNALIAHYQAKLNLQSLAKLLASRPSAELALDQEDERDLMPYPVLDACFELFAGQKLSLPEVFAELSRRFSDDDLKKLDPAYRPGQLKEWVKKFARLFVASIYKWVQSPQGVHVSDLDFDRERALQLPVVQSREWLKLDEL